MADFDRMKPRRRGGLGTPPPVEEASTNLEAPEVAPVAPPMRPTLSAPPPRAAREASAAGGRTIDGRSLRRTGRTVQFATRVSPNFDDRLRALAQRDGLLLVEILERALDLYEGQTR